MKGLAGRKLSRTSSHRNALLRNLVTSLIQHERISTTYAKAKEAQRAAEKIITKAKRSIFQDRIQQHVKARDYVYARNDTVPQLLELAKRFENRPGGYTRIHLHGNRQGDNAPRAILELVDTPGGDFKLEMTAMALGRETFLRTSQGGSKALEEEIATMTTRPLEQDERFNLLTRVNAEKVLKYRGEEGKVLLREKAREHFYRLMATEQIEGVRRPDAQKWESLQEHAPRGEHNKVVPMRGMRRYAGMRKDSANQEGPEEPVPTRPGRKNSVIRIGKGSFARKQNSRVRMPVSTLSRNTSAPRPVPESA
jgi:large subunit ribosomal protein L17